jgi:hypothetical protein
LMIGLGGLLTLAWVIFLGWLALASVALAI